MHPSAKEWLRKVLFGYSVYMLGMLSIVGYFAFCRFTGREILHFNVLAVTMGMLVLMRLCLPYLFPSPEIPDSNDPPKD